MTLATSSEEVKEMISDLNKRFDSLKNSVKQCLMKLRVSVKRVVDVLTSLQPHEDNYHHNKMFLKSHVRVLYQAADIPELFGTMNFHWNYLNPSLLDHLVHRLALEEPKQQMEVYKSDLQQFRMKTPLTLFCQTLKRKKVKPPPEFREMVAEFDWPENVTLEDVEQFRQEYASHYNLQQCAMMTNKVLTGGING